MPEKVLSTSSIRLLKLLMEEDKRAPLAGRTFLITAIGEGLHRVWTLVEVKK